MSIAEGLEFRVLGPLEVDVDGRSVPVTAPQARSLLLILIVRANAVVSTDQLIDGLWETEPPASAAKLIQTYISRLRKLVGTDTIETTPNGYRLRAAAADIDSLRFERLAEEGDHAASSGNSQLASSIYRRGLALWRGQAFVDAVASDVVRLEAHRLENLRFRCLEGWLQAEVDDNGGTAVLTDLADLASVEPLRETPHRLLMLSLYRAGRHADALDTYQAFREALDEVGLEPSTQLRELERQILNHDPALISTWERSHDTRTLPSPASSFVGRTEEIDALHRLVTRDDVRLLTLVGAGGSGKSRLALEIARAAAQSFANGATLVELAPVLSPDLVPSAIATALGLQESKEQPLLDRILEHLASRELLLLIDNAEHLRGAAPIYAELARSAPRLTILVTSRAVLHLSGEHVFPVGPLPPADAVELFRQRAEALNHRFVLTKRNREDVETICRRVDGLPLAIELGAARTGTLTPSELAKRLDKRLPLLTSSNLDLPARQQTLLATIDWSVNLLDDRAKRALARLAVVPDSGSIDLAEHVCDCDLDTITALFDNSLAQRVTSEGRTRLLLLETIREHSLHRLGAQRPEVEARFTNYVCELVERAPLQGTHQARGVAELDEEIHNVRAAVEYAAAHSDPNLELRLVGALFRYWWIRGYLTEGRTKLERAIDRAGTTASPPLAKALRGIAGLAWAQGDLKQAAAYAQRAVSVAEAADDLDQKLGALIVLALVANNNGEYEDAVRHLETTLTLAEEHDLEHHAMTARMNLGAVLLESGDVRTAIPHLEQMLAFHEGREISEGIGFAHLNLGQARYRLSEYTAAEAHFDQARRGFENVGFRAHIGHALQGQAAATAQLGNFEAAARLLGKAALELNEVGSSPADFDQTLPADAERLTRAALGETAYEEIRGP